MLISDRGELTGGSAWGTPIQTRFQRLRSFFWRIFDNVFSFEKNFSIGNFILFFSCYD